ncbi:MAG TPA: DoxX family protein [Longimicrobium sp.]|nr:DoxX family protein [Longimicrobium sp.]
MRPASAESSGRRVSRAVLAAAFVFAGVMHFAITTRYMRIMPPWIPLHRAMVLLSGACEIAGGIGLLAPRTRRAAAIGLVLLLIAVFPANVQMLLNARAAHASTLALGLLWARLPLQIVIVAWVAYAAGLRRGAG